MKTLLRSLPLLGALLPWPAAVGAAPVAPAPPATIQRRPVAHEAQIVPLGVNDLLNSLQRLRIYLVHAPPGIEQFGTTGPGRHVWFLLPSCRLPDPMDPRDACPIDRIEVTSLSGGTVRSSGMTTAMSGDVARRVQAYAIGSDVRLLRIRLITPNDDVRFEGIVDATQLAALPTAEGRAATGGFEIDFGRYPAR